MSAVLDEMARSAYTWNGAISYSTTGTDKYAAILDYWTKAGTYQGRTQEAVNADMVRIFADDEKAALSAVFGLRLITRKPNGIEGIDESQTGYGRKDEFFKALNWMCDNRPALVNKNLHLIPVFGCWKDFLQTPLVERLGTFRNAVYAMVKDNLGDPMLRKYLPKIYSSGQKVQTSPGKWKLRCRTPRAQQLVQWAKGLCRYLGINYAAYRKLKSSGKGHIWQQQMSRGEWDKIHFNGIPGRAMLFHTSRKNRKDKLTVFERHGQIERLKEWVLKQPTVKFTGYPYELVKAASIHKSPTILQKLVYDKQFEAMIEPMKNHSLGNVLCALDTSGSMGSPVGGGVTTALDVCVSMGLTFSALNTGHFKDHVVQFSDRSSLMKLHGTFCEKLHQIQSAGWFMGSTNFQSVIDLIVDVRKRNPGIPVSEYPETLLVISDMQFNPTSGNAETNYEAAMRKLREIGLSDMRIIWWFVNGAGTDFPSKMTDRGVYMIGGFDPNNLKALMGLSSTKKEFVAAERKEETPLDGMMNFLQQPIFGLLQM